MKRLSLLSVTALCAVLALGSVGCMKKPGGVTPLPFGQAGGSTGPSNPNRGVPIGDGAGIGGIPVATASTDPAGGTPLSGSARDITNAQQDREKFKTETVHFDLDKSIVKAEDMGKVQTVAAFLKSNPGHDVLVEGHCDERGTENYNLSLGDRRALAVREALIAAGAPAERVHTISYGESRPAEDAKNEAAYAKNRRGEFVLVLP
jgi:peptidoglycan-associated lipoprotein